MANTPPYSPQYFSAVTRAVDGVRCGRCRLEKRNRVRVEMQMDPLPVMGNHIDECLVSLAEACAAAVRESQP